MTATKLGPHVIRPSADALLWAARAPVVKALNDTTALRQSPDATIRVFRKYFPTQDINRSGMGVVREVLAALGGAPATHIELFNECFQRLGQGLERYVEFTREAVDYLEIIRPDLTLVAFCFSTGNPDWDDWVYLRQHGYGGAEVIGLHQYWGWQNFTPWNALRHRLADAWTQGDHPNFLVTECGRDAVEGGHGGWHADELAESTYLDELLAYEAEILTDSYVLAATPFTSGPTTDWEKFSIDPLAARLAALAGPLPEEPPMPSLRGIDISSHQGPTIDFAAVKASGISFVWIKATEAAGYVNPYFAAHWQAAGRAGLIRGVYAYAQPDQASPAEHVELLKTTLENAGGLAAGDLMALDLEEGSSADLLVWAAECLSLMETVFAVAPFIYSGHWFLSAHNLEDHAASLGRYPLWLASYQAAPPPVPAGWGAVTIWQFSASGDVPGVGAVDLDVFDGGVSALQGFGSLHGWGQPAEPVNPVPAFDIDAARNSLWAQADALGDNGYEWLSQGIKALVAVSKGDR